MQCTHWSMLAWTHHTMTLLAVKRPRVKTIGVNLVLCISAKQICNKCIKPTPELVLPEQRDAVCCTSVNLLRLENSFGKLHSDIIFID